MATDPDTLVSECDRLRKVLQGAGVSLTQVGVSGAEPSIQGTYDPMYWETEDQRGFALIALTGVSDADLRDVSTP
jgi:hypothetical protein